MSSREEKRPSLIGLPVVTVNALAAAWFPCYLPFMSMFSFLFIPIFALFRRSLVTLAGGTMSWKGVSSGFVLGSAVSFFGRIIGRFWIPRGFGLDALAAQVLFGPFMIVIMPIMAYFLLKKYLYHRNARREATDTEEILNFSFAWLVPVFAIRTLEWSAIPDPVNLVLVPVLSAALLLSLKVCIKALGAIRNLPILAGALGLIAFSFSASVAPWGFITHRFWMGLAGASVTLIGAMVLETPLILRIRSVLKSRKSEIHEGIPQA